MLSGTRFALPLLKVTLGWWTWLFIAFWITVTLLDWCMLLQPGPGFGAAVGGGAMMALSCSFGVSLRLCRGVQRSRLLPRFEQQGLLSVSVILIPLIIAFATVDGWRLDSMLALFAAVGLGLGAGLSMPMSWLGLLMMTLFLFGTIVDHGVSFPWTSVWSPMVGAVFLLSGLLVFFKTGPKRPTNFAAKRLLTSTAMDVNHAVRQAHRLGFLLSCWPLAVASTSLGLLLGNAQDARLRREQNSIVHYLEPEAVSVLTMQTLSTYLVMFSCLGVLAMLQQLLLPRRVRILRRLAVLPGWRRSRLFSHAELSAWRGGVIQAALLGVALFGAGLWAGQLDFQLWLSVLVYLLLLTGVCTYTALWLAIEPNPILRSLGLAVTFFALYFAITFGVHRAAVADEHRQLAYLAAPAAALVAWWLRRRASAAWNSINLSRYSGPLAGRSE